MWESPETEILPNDRDRSVFSSIDHLLHDGRIYGYYGGIRLLKAAVRRQMMSGLYGRLRDILHRIGVEVLKPALVQP